MFSSHKGENVFFFLAKRKYFLWKIPFRLLCDFKKFLGIWTALQKCSAAAGTRREKLPACCLPHRRRKWHKLLALFWLVICLELKIIKTNPCQQLPWESCRWSVLAVTVTVLYVSWNREQLSPSPPRPTAVTLREGPLTAGWHVGTAEIAGG